MSAMVEVEAEVAGHVLRAGAEAAGTQAASIEGQLGGDGEAVPVAVARGQAVLPRLGPRRVGVAHLQRVEDVLLDVGLVGLPRDRLHDHAQRPVVGVAVLPGRAHRLGEFGIAQRPDPVLEGGVVSVPAGRVRVAGRLRQPADLVQQMANRDSGLTRPDRRPATTVGSAAPARPVAAGPPRSAA